MIKRLSYLGEHHLQHRLKDIKYLQRSNFFAVFVILLVPVFIPVFLWVGAGWHTISLLGIVITATAILLLNYYGFFKLASALQAASFGFWLLFFCWLFGKNSQAHLLYIVFCTMPFLFFSRENQIIRISVIILYIFLFFAVELQLFSFAGIIEVDHVLTIVIFLLIFIWIIVNFWYFSLTSENNEHRLGKALVNLEKSNKEMEQFVYIASHDLQEPLRSLLSFSELMEEEKLDDDSRIYLGFIKKSAERMEILIEGLMNHSRLGLNKQKEAVDLNKVVEAVMVDLSDLINRNRAIIEESTLPVVYGYPLEIRALIQNILSNAIKFKRKGIDPKVRIRFSDQDEFWRIEIEDNGIGIDSKFGDRIFAMFQQLNARNAFEGYGIGLAHCKKIVELHNGELGYTSTLGSGSCFYFTLPKF